MEIIIRGEQGEGKTQLRQFLIAQFKENGICTDIHCEDCGDYEKGLNQKTIDFLQEKSDDKPITIKEEQI